MSNTNNNISDAWNGFINRSENTLIRAELERPNRKQRDDLGKVYISLMTETAQRGYSDESLFVHSAVCPIGWDTAYYFMLHKAVDRKEREADLERGCLCTRAMFPGHPKVLGIASEWFVKESERCSYSFAILNSPVWTSEDELRVKEIKQRFAKFREMKIE